MNTSSRRGNWHNKYNYGVDWLQKDVRYGHAKLDCFKMYTISDKIIKIIEKTIKNWRVELKSGGKILAEVKIQRDLF